MVGKTATLELKPEQAETLARARQSGTLTLALRSIVDVNAVEKAEEQVSKRDEGLNVIRYGVASSSRCRSDRKDARNEVQGNSARCGHSSSAPCRFRP